MGTHHQVAAEATGALLGIQAAQAELEVDLEVVAWMVALAVAKVKPSHRLRSNGRSVHVR